MAAITYTANARAPLVTDSPAHVAGNSYSIDVKLQAYNTQLEQPKTQHISIGGAVETVLRRVSPVHTITLIWPDTLDDSMNEFLYSVAAGENFSFDAYGTVAVPDNAVNMFSVSSNLDIGRMTHGSTPWRSVTMKLRPVI